MPESLIREYKKGGAGRDDAGLVSEREAGHFIHYGIYAVGDVSESWSFHNGNISYEDYMKQCEGFTASKFDAKNGRSCFKSRCAVRGYDSEAP